MDFGELSQPARVGLRWVELLPDWGRNGPRSLALAMPACPAVGRNSWGVPGAAVLSSCPGPPPLLQPDAGDDLLGAVVNLRVATTPHARQIPAQAGMMVWMPE